MNSPAIIVLTEASLTIAHQIQAALPAAVIYGLAHRTPSLACTYDNFGETVREFFQAGRPIIGLCAAGILIRTLAPLIRDKGQEPPVLAIATDGSAVVPLLGGVQGVNELARQIAEALQVAPAITTTGDLRFGTALLSPPPGYQLVNPENAKTFIAELLAGAEVQLKGEAAWLTNSQLPISPTGKLTLQIETAQQSADQLTAKPAAPDCLVYRFDPQRVEQALHSQESRSQGSRGNLAILGIGPGAAAWMSAEVKERLKFATDWVGYQTYLNLVEPLRPAHTRRYASDNRCELERAEFALDLAAQGGNVALISSGDPGIYAMAAAVFEVLEQKAKPAWESIEIQVCPGISAMQAAAAQVGAPLGHDFCVISLSDILKPWEVIAQRITAAAQADFAIAFYNPVSKDRSWQLDKARELLLPWRSADTPTLLAHNLGREGQRVVITTLGQLKSTDADMRTVIVIGSSQTRIMSQGQGQQWVYTPRHYRNRVPPQPDIH
ncbi:MAG: precorrin-3B C(17)-methyltransferase [Acaryochloridaceae cyanobacterium SU_2_1]|nr:precorrin-3B C(17)-methyltransferase [Acaryochloridaceae cyanobacterium SU_2_1]